MKVLELTLHKNVRLSAANIETITINMEELIQCMLGTNGSGKSTILDSLSPLPAVKADYADGGYKEIIIEHNTNHYKLVSAFSGKGSGDHEFWFGETNLNDGGTASVQKALVKEHFDGYDQELHDVLTGDVVFTEMGPSLRKQWFIRMADCDMSYIIALHDKIKKEARDSVGAHKYIQERIAQESAKAMDAEQLKENRDKAVQIKDELKVLLEERVVSKAQEDVGLQEIDRLDDEIVKYCTAVINVDYSPVKLTDGKETSCPNTLLSVVEKLSADRDKLTTQLDSLNQEHYNLTDIKEKVSTFDDIDIGSVEKYIADGERKLMGLRNRIQQWGDIENPKHAISTIDSVYATISDITTDLREYNYRECSKEVLQAKQDQLAEIKGKYTQLTDKQKRCQERIIHIEHSDRTTCTNCGYTFKPGVKDEDLGKLKEYLLKYNEAEARGLAMIEELETSIAGILTYQDLLRRLSDVCRDAVALQPVWNKALTMELHKSDPTALIGEINMARRDCALLLEIEQLEADLAPQRKLLEDYKLHSERSLGSTAEFDKRLAAIDEEIEALTSQLSTVVHERARLNEVLNSWNYANDAVDKIRYLVDERNAEAVRIEESLRQREICSLTDGHHHRLAVLENSLREAETVEETIASLKEQEAQLGFSGKAYPVMIDALGPVSGLIAQQLYGAIETVTDSINNVIESIWTVPLSVVPCGLENGELNYKFPLDRGVERNAPDVDNGSMAQVEIVNFAFRIAVYGCLGLKGWPLWVDELSKTFDEQHRSNTMTYLKELMASGAFSQMFLVSHYATNHGVFTNAEVCVLDDTNVTVPGKYNDHVSIK